MLSYEDLLREAASAGFHPDPMEKALRLLELLESLRSHPFLKERIVLKGGSALNMFVFQLPRLSVDIDVDPKDVEGQLLLLLRADLAPKRSEVRGWSDHLVSECRKRLSMLMPLTRSEVEFLTFLNEQGEIVPELLAEDVKMQSLIRAHPGLRWKAQNVLEHRARKL